MDRNLNEILEDLFMIDPSLKKHKKDVSRIVQAMLEAQPDTQFDEAFARRLKSQLLAKTQEPEQTRFNFAQALQKWMYGFGGAAVALAVVVAIMSNEMSAPLLSTSMVADQSVFKANTITLPRNAFGSLATLTSANSGAPTPESAAENNGLAFGMGGAGANPTSVAGMGGDLSIDSRLIAPGEFLYFTYVYEGDTLVLDQTQADVFRRLKGNLPASSVISSLQGMNLGLANLGSFDNLKLMNFQLVEDKDNGLSISVDMNEESLSIYQNWMRWQYDYNRPQVPADQAPSDEELIRIAQDFVEQHNIDISAYGAPYVDKRWQQYYIMERSSQPAMVPNDMTVRYPLLLEGNEVKEQYGEDHGLFVNISLQHMKVSGFSNLTTQRYEKSSYDLETDASRVLKIAEQGGNQWFYEQPEGSRTVEVSLGTPRQVYMRYWMPDGNTSRELYVPALYFPVTDKPEEGAYLQDGVVVPLAKEVLDQYGQTPEFMPLERPLMMEGGAAVSEPAIETVEPMPAIMPRG